MSYNRFLFHFTCSHAAPLIDKAGALIPQVAWRRLDELLLASGEPMTGLWRAPAVVWLTHERRPDREALGLTSRTLSCDRTEFRYSVANMGEAMMWTDFARLNGANPDYLRTLTGDPSLWWVAPVPLRVVGKVDRRRLSALANSHVGEPEAQ